MIVVFLTTVTAPLFQPLGMAASAVLAQAAETPVDVHVQFRVLLVGLTIFALAVFTGFELITKVPPTLHTPLMSGSNAISGITLIGAIICAGRGGEWHSLGRILGFVAVVLATVNVVGGYFVTNRMLLMFKKKK